MKKRKHQETEQKGQGTENRIIETNHTNRLPQLKGSDVIGGFKITDPEAKKTSGFSLILLCDDSFGFLSPLHESIELFFLIFAFFKEATRELENFRKQASSVFCFSLSPISFLPIDLTLSFTLFLSKPSKTKHRSQQQQWDRTHHYVKNGPSYLYGPGQCLGLFLFPRLVSGLRQGPLSAQIYSPWINLIFHDYSIIFTKSLFLL